MKPAPYAGTPLHISTAANVIVETWAGSALPPSEPLGVRERSRLATCSLPVSSVEEIAGALAYAAGMAHELGRPEKKAKLIAFGFDLLRRAHEAAATMRQPEENIKDEPRPL